MSLRYIFIPAVHSKPVRLGRYVAFIKAAKAAPDAEFKHGLTCWWPVTGAEILQQFREGLAERINQAAPYYLRGAA